MSGSSSKSTSTPSPLDKKRAEILEKYTDVYGPHLQTPQQLQNIFGQSLVDRLNSPGGPAPTPQIGGGNTGYQGSGSQARTTQPGVNTPGGGQEGKSPGSQTPTPQGGSGRFGNALGGNAQIEPAVLYGQGQTPGTPAQTQGPGQNGDVLKDLYQQLSRPADFSSPAFQSTAVRPDAPELTNFFDGYSGPKSFYEGHQGPTNFYDQHQGPTSFFKDQSLVGPGGAVQPALGRLQGGDAYNVGFDKFFDDFNSYGDTGEVSGLGGFSRHASKVFGDRLNRDAAKEFGAEGSKLGASGLLNSSALGNLQSDINERRGQTLAEYETGLLGDTLGLHGNLQNAEAGRRLQADQGLLETGFRDFYTDLGGQRDEFSRDLESRRGDFDTGLDRQLGGHQANQSNLLNQFGIGRDIYLGERQADLGRYQTDVQARRQANDAYNSRIGGLFDKLGDVHEDDRRERVNIATLPNRVFGQGLGTIPGAPLTNSSQSGFSFK